jgi:hypothetical protein
VLVPPGFPCEGLTGGVFPAPPGLVTPDPPIDPAPPPDPPAVSVVPPPALLWLKI